MPQVARVAIEGASGVSRLTQRALVVVEHPVEIPVGRHVGDERRQVHVGGRLGQHGPRAGQVAPGRGGSWPGPRPCSGWTAASASAAVAASAAPRRTAGARAAASPSASATVGGAGIQAPAPPQVLDRLRPTGPAPARRARGRGAGRHRSGARARPLVYCSTARAVLAGDQPVVVPQRPVPLGMSAGRAPAPARRRSAPGPPPRAMARRCCTATSWRSDSAAQAATKLESSATACS